MTGTRFVQALLAISATFPTAFSASIPAGAISIRQSSPVWPSSLSSQAHDESWPEFAAKTQRWSAYAAPTFDEVFLPRTEADLSAGLRYLTSNNITFLAKSGGHGYSPTLGIVQDAVMINLENFKYVNMNRDNTVTVGTGALFGDLVNTLYANNREITVGSCPCVGATGAMLGGGLGRLQGLHGMNSDALRRVKVALYNGTIIEASDRVNQDLFWGIRGAGQNFGIVLESTFETWPATNNGQHYNADLYFNKRDLTRVMDIVNRLAHPRMDPLLNLIPFIAYNTTTQEAEVIVNMQFAGPLREAQKVRRQFSGLATRYQESMVSWPDTFTAAVGGLINFSCIKGFKYNMRGVITETLHTPTLRDFAQDLETFVEANPTANMSMMMIETFPSRGVERLPDNYSAFPHRRNFANMVEFVMTYEQDSAADAVNAFGIKWRDIFAQPRVSGYDRMYVYQNYANKDEPLKSIYGYDSWRHRRLTDLKNKYDPLGVFNAYHAIPKTLAGWN